MRAFVINGWRVRVIYPYIRVGAVSSPVSGTQRRAQPVVAGVCARFVAWVSCARSVLSATL